MFLDGLNEKNVGAKPMNTFKVHVYPHNAIQNIQSILHCKHTEQFYSVQKLHFNFRLFVFVNKVLIPCGAF